MHCEFRRMRIGIPQSVRLSVRNRWSKWFFTLSAIECATSFYWINGFRVAYPGGNITITFASLDIENPALRSLDTVIVGDEKWKERKEEESFVRHCRRIMLPLWRIEIRSCLFWGEAGYGFWIMFLMKVNYYHVYWRRFHSRHNEMSHRKLFLPPHEYS